MKNRRFSLLAVLLLAIAMLLAACGSSNRSDYAVSESAAFEDSYSYESYEDAKQSSGDVYTNSNAVKDRMLVYNVFYNLESTTYEETRNALENKAVELGGYISSYESSTGSYERVSYVFRIPTGKLDAFTALIEEQGNVTRKSTDVKDYTDVYYDYSTEIELLKTEEEYIITYLDEATESADRAALIDQLLSIRREIARLEREKSNITEVVMYSTVTVDVRNVASYTDITVKYGDSLRDAFFKGWTGFANVMKGLLYVIILLSPLLVVIAVIVVLVLVIVRLATRKSRKKKAPAALPTAAPAVQVPETAKQENDRQE